MSGSYDDIIHMSHHVSPVRKRMSMIDRAAQFSPFAALTGYDAIIRETGRITDDPLDLDVDAIAILSGRIQRLAERKEEHPKVTVTYFVPDEKKAGGSYHRITGRMKKVDPHKRLIILADGTEISFDRMIDLDGEIFQNEI